jgi:hypothetical protein
MAGKRWSPRTFWVIFGYVDEHAQPLYWSNEEGWVSLESATVFSDGQKDRIAGNVPDPGVGSWTAEWVQIPYPPWAYPAKED